MLKVFVYGTLKPGKPNYCRYCEGKIIGLREATARGQLFYLPQLGYPAMMRGEGSVRGVVLHFEDAAILRVLDELEDFKPDRPPEENEYNRTKVEVFDLTKRPLGWVWTYTMFPEKIHELGGVPLVSGEWEPGMFPVP
ncbi:MAG: gamma-glutamylcyclotransferase [Coleofasciculaceae cyanobacterium SM2_3_26]|nr:gamma-glutamylcyclotransferase [Coleofasciculaceae cyanobacterium SM2_3_26]